MTPGSETPRPRRRSGKRGEGQAATRDGDIHTQAGPDWQDDSEAAAVLDRPPARRKAGELASLLALLDHLPPAREVMEREVRK